MRGALLIVAATLVGACEGPGSGTPKTPSLDEQAALEKAEAMIEENRDRIENQETEGEE
ncbi:hypothetical protein [Altererythrobacter sp. MF3-039]|uniref:hypothetical protein n=1 Tax=Altererythrobacter sp. MF3-039 TaxID=3252901 RepID=UPI00390CB12B